MNRYYGFNYLWMFNAPKGVASPLDVKINERELDFAAAMGCNFVRIPLDYRYWVRDFCYGEADEGMLAKVDECVLAVVSRGMHCSLNLHRAPGYCINGNELEKHNLWIDREAQEAFVAQWQAFAVRYVGLSPAALSFDLLNEPPNIGQYGMTRENHAALMRRTAAAIREVSPGRPITLDGLGGGNIAMPELADLGVTMSTRGYQPMTVTHFNASWCDETRGLPAPRYPGTVYNGKTWNQETLLEHYRPWKTLADAGVAVHIGEFGIYNRVDNSLALRWFRDVLSVFRKLGWGYALWNFAGPFGIVDHGRPGTRWETIDGFRVDREMYELFKEFMEA